MNEALAETIEQVMETLVESVKFVEEARKVFDEALVSHSEVLQATYALLYVMSEAAKEASGESEGEVQSIDDEE